MSEQKPTIAEIYNVIFDAWKYFDDKADVIDGDNGTQEPNAEKVLADLASDMLTRLELMEEVNV